MFSNLISIICVYNDETVLNVNLIASLKEQTERFELILIDNRNGQFKTLTKALNHGGLQAKGDYLMFIHQDVKLIDPSWLMKSQNIIKTIENLGAAGVVGIDNQGNPIGFIKDRGLFWGYPIKKPNSVMTLDEVLIIIPKHIFKRIKFDENFKWHSWAADYCLKVRSLGLKTVVLPLSISHNSATAPILKISKLENEDLKLLLKYGKKIQEIHKTTSTINLQKMKSKKFIKIQSIRNRIFSYLFELQKKEIFKKRNKIIDIVNPLEQQYIKDNIISNNYSVGVSNRIEYLIASKRINIHKNYLLCSLLTLPFRESVVDLVILKSILEYLPKQKGIKLLKMLEELKMKIMVFVPNNGYPKSKAYKYYRSIWQISEFKNQGYKIYGFNSKNFFNSVFGKIINNFCILLAWWFPKISGIFLAVKK